MYRVVHFERLSRQGHKLVKIVYNECVLAMMLNFGLLITPGPNFVECLPLQGHKMFTSQGHKLFHVYLSRS